MRLTHVKRLASRQTDFGIPLADYWFEWSADGPFANHVIFNEAETDMTVEFFSFDGGFSQTALEMILANLVGTGATSGLEPARY